MRKIKEKFANLKNFRFPWCSEIIYVFFTQINPRF